MSCDSLIGIAIESTPLSKLSNLSMAEYAHLLVVNYLTERCVHQGILDDMYWNSLPRTTSLLVKTSKSCMLLSHTHNVGSCQQSDIACTTFYAWSTSIVQTCSNHCTWSMVLSRAACRHACVLWLHVYKWQRNYVNFEHKAQGQIWAQSKYGKVYPHSQARGGGGGE